MLTKERLQISNFPFCCFRSYRCISVGSIMLPLKCLINYEIGLIELAFIWDMKELCECLQFSPTYLPDRKVNFTLHSRDRFRNSYKAVCVMCSKY